MKKMIAFLLLCAGCFGFYFACNMSSAFGQSKSLAANGAESICFVTNMYNDIQDENVSVVQSGNQYYFYMPIHLETKYQNLKGVRGYVYYYPSNVPVDVLKAQLMQFSEPAQVVGKTTVITGFTNAFLDFRLVNGKKINIQMAITEEAIIVGYPMILTGF